MCRVGANIEENGGSVGGASTLLREMDAQRADALITVHEDSDSRFSYAQMNAGTNQVVAVGDKVPVTNMACTGIYMFRSGRLFVEAAKSLFAKNTVVRGQFYLHKVVDDVAADLGRRVVAVTVSKVWSVRTVVEIAGFQREYVEALAHQQLQVVYEEMRRRQHAALLSKGTQGDPELCGVDSRRCLAAYQLCGANNWLPTKAFGDLCLELRKVLRGDHVLYGTSDAIRTLDGVLHFTLMQLIGFDVYDPSKLPADYCEVIQGLLVNRLPKFECRFDSVVVTPRNMFVYGTASCDVNHVRGEIRRELSRIGYPLLEPYKSDMIHMTLVRFTKPLSPEQLAAVLDLTKQVSGRQLGNLLVDRISISEASWKMQPNELPAKCADAELP